MTRKITYHVVRLVAPSAFYPDGSCLVCFSGPSLELATQIHARELRQGFDANLLTRIATDDN